MNTAREFHAVGIVTDEATLEVFVVVTGGKDKTSHDPDPIKSTEILIGDAWTIGNKK